MEILGVKIDNLDKQGIFKKLEDFLRDGRQHYIVTTNPEFLVESRRDQEFKSILNYSDLSIADGTGLVFVSWFLRQPIKQRMTGADLTEYLLKKARQKKLSVLLINWSGGLSSANSIKRAVQKNHPGLQFEIVDVPRSICSGSKFLNHSLLYHAHTPVRNAYAQRRRTQHDLKKLSFSQAQNKSRQARFFSPDILFVNLGAPYQEKFIYQNLKSIPSVRLAVGVGGAFDFISGRRRRAPRAMRSVGLEWAWRLFCHPWRIRRVHNAVIKFPLLVLFKKFGKFP
jgi:N-acetylglucosaminyldiphosphoundecaprenol N-acetyl-beta-D-mannosaminyltransferase